MSANKWYKNSYRRNLVDMHIEDWDEFFLSKFDPEQYVKMMKTARVQSAAIYANSHVGLCYWPSESGQMHRGLKGRDIFGELVKLCHGEGIDVIVYYSLVFNNVEYERHPEWRLLDASGQPSRSGDRFSGWLKPRYGICCPNNMGYQSFVEAQLAELASNYDFEGVFFDMNFWPDVCYCQSCRARYRDEVGAELPLVLNWADPDWRRFQKKREQWIAESAVFASSTIKKLKPGVTTQHNFGQILINWEFAYTDLMVPSSDYLGGDFYGDMAHASFVAKLLMKLSPNEPFDYWTSRAAPGLNFHTDIKPKDAFMLMYFICLAHNGAFVFIDAINLDGTLDPAVYELLGEIFEETIPYDSFRGGELVTDVGIYFSTTSKMHPDDPNDNGKSMDGWMASRGGYPHLEASMGAARALKESHIPYGVITKTNLKEAFRFKTLILPDIAFMDEQEIEAFTRFVEQGGSIYASGRTANVLPELLGVEPTGRTSETFTYLAPAKEDGGFLPGVRISSPLTVPESQVIARAVEPDSVKGFMVLPFTDPHDQMRFSSIHSNPPGKWTEIPAVVYRSVGKGRTVWLSGAIEKQNNPAHKATVTGLVTMLTDGGFQVSTNAPAQVEITVFADPGNDRIVVNLVNMQEQLPILPVYDFSVTVSTGGKKASDVSLAPDHSALDWSESNGSVTFAVAELELFRMVEIRTGA